MRKYLFLLVFQLLFCSQQQYAQKIETGYYQLLKGTISNIPITMNLTQCGDDYSGIYYYDKYQIPIFMGGKLNATKNKIELTSEINGKVETFSLNKLQDDFNGEWVSGNRILPVKLNRVNTPFNWKTYRQELTLPLRPNMEDGPKLSCNVKLVWPEGESPTADFVRKQILKMLSLSTNSTTNRPEDIIRSVNNEFRKTYFEAHKDDSNEDIKEHAFSFSEEHNVGISLYNLNYQYLTLEKDFYEYLGGAHGMGGSIFVNLDIKLKTEITLSNLFTPSGLKQLPRLLEQQFRIDQKLKPGQSLVDGGLFENKIEQVSDNFYMTQKGIGFYYLQYEIAPYVMGPIEIVLPFSKIKALLKPTAMSYFIP